jgi:hypothetical protein
MMAIKSTSRQWAVLALAVTLVMPTSLLAGSFAEKAKAELQAYGTHAGYITATIDPCGGDEAEVIFFTGQVKKMLGSVGGDDVDFAIVQKAMTKGRADAKPAGRDCTDEGGMGLASKLIQLRDAVRDAAK